MTVVYIVVVALVAAAANGAYSPGSQGQPNWNQHSTGAQLHNTQQYTSPHHPMDYAEVTTPMDLTHPLDTNALEWPNNTAFIHENVTGDEERGYFYASQDIRMGEHVGTHMDAPYHLNRNGHKVSSCIRLFSKRM